MTTSAVSSTHPDPDDRATVLVVDDSRTMRSLLRRILEPAGFEVVEASDGAAALAVYDGCHVDVVISDLAMPGLDGFGLLEAIRQRDQAPEVILLTGSHAEDIEAAIRALRLGAHDYLTKPPGGPEVVVLAVERALETKRLRDANRRLLAELEVLSRTDPLTGVLNRRSFDDALAREAQRAERYGFPLALALLDIDHFKSVNDRFGHPVGDAVLRHVAQTICQSIRQSDSVYRYGGEEFAVLFPHCDPPGTAIVAGRLVTRIEASPAWCEELEIPVSISAGVSTLATAGSPATLVFQADTALYEAKRGGRNQVRIWDPRGSMTVAGEAPAVTAEACR